MLYPVNLQFFADDDKTEKATPKKREDVRKKGQTAKSQEVVSALVRRIFHLIDRDLPHFGRNHRHLPGIIPPLHFIRCDREHHHPYFCKFTHRTHDYFITGVFSSVYCCRLANFLQVGVMITAEPLKMKGERINPINGAKRIFSMKAVVELVKSILKIAIIAAIVIVF